MGFWETLESLKKAGPAHSIVLPVEKMRRLKAQAHPGLDSLD